MSFRFLNPSLVDEYPYGPDSVCYRGLGPDEPDVLCRDLPPNRMRFLGWWKLTPERHFLEWFGFVLTGILVLVLLGPTVGTRISSTSNQSIIPQCIRIHGNSNSSTEPSSLLAPRLWMKACTLVLYPYVAYTKLSWEGSNYPGRWLLFVCMPVGTLWIGSALFCFGSTGLRRNTSYRYALRCYGIRYFILDIWLSCVPMLGIDLLLGLGREAAWSVRRVLQRWSSGVFWTSPSVAHDGDNAYGFYFCHALYLVLAPLFYVLWTGELTMYPPRSARGGQHSCLAMLGRLAIECALRQAVGTAVAVLYYMGIVTPASIVAGLNVNSLLDDGGSTQSFRVWTVAMWLRSGWLIRLGLGLVEVVMQGSRRMGPSGHSGTVSSSESSYGTSDSKRW